MGILILYISSSTSYAIYDQMFEKVFFAGSSPAQKYNDNLMKGLSNFDEVISLSSLLYKDINSARIEETHDKIKYICIKNYKGKIKRRIGNIYLLYTEGKKIIKSSKDVYIICDAISLSPAISSFLLSKIHKVKATALITDIPSAMCNQGKTKMSFLHEKLMSSFDSFILMTSQMNMVINKANKPYLIIEGICSEQIPDLYEKNESVKKIIMYSGALWKHDAGIEYFIKGFVKADLPNTELHFYGQGELVDWLKKLEIKFPNVKYMGCLTNNEIVKKQQSAWLLINPRPSSQRFTQFSFPSKTVEYMLSGTPVLTTKLPGIPDDYLAHLFILNDENVIGVKNKLIELNNMSDEEFLKKGKTAREFVVENKNPKKQGSKVFSMIKR